MVDGNSNHNPLCGKKIRITRPNGGRTRSVDVTVVDRCEACAAEGQYSYNACNSCHKSNMNEQTWI